MNGGKVSSSPAAKSAAAMRLICRRLTSRCAQRLESAIHTTSHTMIAASVTPERGPVGRQRLNARASVAKASPPSAKTPRAQAPIAAESSAAAAEPFGGFACSSVMGLSVHEHERRSAPDRCVLVQHRAEEARDGRRHERERDQAEDRVAKRPHRV
jgi:hypothetical protein